MKKPKIYLIGTTQWHPLTGRGRDCSVALRAPVRWRRPLQRRSSDLGEAKIPTPPSSTSLSSSSSSSVRSCCRRDRDRDCRSQCSSALLLVFPSRIRASPRHLASMDGALWRDRIRPSVSRGGRFSPTVNDDDVDDNKDNIFCHHGIIDALRCCDCSASSAAVVVVQVIVPVIDSISMAPCIRAQNSAAVNSPERTTVPVSALSATNGTYVIDDINVRG